jgi:hypothetical protein
MNVKRLSAAYKSPAYKRERTIGPLSPTIPLPVVDVSQAASRLTSTLQSPEFARAVACLACQRDLKLAPHGGNGFEATAAAITEKLRG